MIMYLIDRVEKQKIADRFTRSSQLLMVFNRALDWFGRSLKQFFRPGTVDASNIHQVANAQVRELMGRMNQNAQSAYEQILSDGMSASGLNMMRKQVDPNTIRSLYYNSPIWTAYKGMNDRLMNNTNQIITEHMTREGGISYNKLVSELQDNVGLAERKARVIARTESNAVQNQGREIGFRISDPAGTWKFKWGGPYDYRTSDTCKWIKSQSGKGMSLDNLKLLCIEATRKFHPKLTPRDWVPHPNCYVDGYNVLTVNGLKPMKEVKKGEMVWSVNGKGLMEKDRVLRTIKFNYIGPFIRYSNRWFEAETTLDHHYIIRTSRNHFIKRKTEDMGPNDKLTVGGFEWKGKDNDFVEIGNCKFDANDFAYFMGWYLSEGYVEKNRKVVGIAQYKSENFESIEKVMHSLFGKVWLTKGKFRCNLRKYPELYDYLKSFGHSFEKFVPDEIKSLPPKHIESFLQSFMLGDGSWRIKKTIVKGKQITSEERTLFTSSKRLASDLCELIYKIGMTPKINIRKTKGTEAHFKNGTYTLNHDMYIIRIKKSKNAKLRRLDKEIYFDEKEVYDLTIKNNHNMIVEHNGYFMLGSNCRHFPQKVVTRR